MIVAKRELLSCTWRACEWHLEELGENNDFSTETTLIISLPENILVGVRSANGGNSRRHAHVSDLVHVVEYF